MDDYISPEALCPRLRGSDKQEVIDELLRIIARGGTVTNIEEASRAVWSREESMSTGMQFGIAIPHGRTDASCRFRSPCLRS